MNTHPIAQKIKAAYLRALNNEMIGNYQHSIVVNIMRRIVELIFRTPDFAIDLPIEPQWRDHYATALCISAYLGYVQYTIAADDTIAHITLTDPYRAQILAATAPTECATPTECSELSECSEPPTTPAPSECSEPPTAPPTATPTECSELSELSESSEPSTTPPSAPSAPSSPRAAANFSLKDVTLPTQDFPQSPANQRNTLIAPIRLISPGALPPPSPAHPPPRSLSAALS